MSERVGVYVRVSTEDQDLERQMLACKSYAEDEFGVHESEIQYYRDKSTGTNTQRAGYRDLMDDVQSGDLDVVVVKSVSRISRSIRDLDRTVEQIVDESGVDLHIISESLVFASDADTDPFQKAMLRLLGVFAELEADLAQQRTKEGIAAKMRNPEYAHGPAPLGYHKEEGRLIENEDHDRVVSALEMVAKGDLSKRKAARELDTSRATIRRAIEERPELYGL